MKLVDRATFLTLPAGTVYAKYKPCYCDCISIKQSCVGDNDWTYTPFDTVSFVDSESDIDLDTKLLNLKAGDSINTDMQISYRDGLFEYNEQFMVYNKDEIKELIELLTQTLDMDAYK